MPLLFIKLVDILISFMTSLYSWLPSIKIKSKGLNFFKLFLISLELELPHNKINFFL